MQDLIEIFQADFVWRALIAGIMISLSAALLGVILMLKRYSLIGHALADVGFASLSIAVAVGWSPLYVSLPIVIVASFLIMLISQKRAVNGDVAIGMVATASLAAGVIITNLTRGFNIDVYSYMFGSILSISKADVWRSTLLSFAVIAVFIVFYNRLFAVTFDESFARAGGIPVTFYQFLISLLTAVAIVIGMRMIGTMLISSLIIFPAVTAKKLAPGFKGVIFASALISVICFIAGFVLSCLYDLPAGASIVMTNVILLCAVSLLKYICVRSRSKG